MLSAMNEKNHRNCTRHDCHVLVKKKIVINKLN